VNPSDLLEALADKYEVPVWRVALGDGECATAEERVALMLEAATGILTNFLPAAQGPPALSGKHRKAAQAAARKHVLTPRGLDAAVLGAYGLLRWQIESMQTLEYVGSRRELLAGWAPFWAALYNELLDAAPLPERDIDLLDRPNRIYALARDDASLLEQGDHHPVIEAVREKGVMGISDDEFQLLMSFARECSLIETDKAVFRKLLGPDHSAMDAHLFEPSISVRAPLGEGAQRTAWAEGNLFVKEQYVQG
jgi:hypothetical protein